MKTLLRGELIQLAPSRLGPPPGGQGPLAVPSPQPRPGVHLRAVLLRELQALRTLSQGTCGAEELRPERLHAAAFLGHGAARRALGVITQPPPDIDRWARSLEFWGGPGAIVAATLGLLAVWAPSAESLPSGFAHSWAKIGALSDVYQVTYLLERYWRDRGVKDHSRHGGALHGLRVALQVVARQGASNERVRGTLRCAALAWAAEPLRPAVLL
ncbi:MAG: hypothetical protein JKY65_30295 [Planctomycetes bacterium]|nr:hypothetical protein [Planctomycetota bacterium]